MSAHLATIVWRRDGAPFSGGKFSRGHTWQFDGGTSVAASASPSIVPAPYSVAAAVDPEEAFVASLSSCHMLWFLDLAWRGGFIVDTYDDAAQGTLAKDASGRLAITEVVLRPRVVFGGERRPAAEELAALHHKAHEKCFIATSVKTNVRVEVT